VEQTDDLVGLAYADAEDERAAGQHRLVDRVVDGHPTDLADPVGIAVDEVQQRGPEVVEDPPETGAGSWIHRVVHRPNA
jgi:hypothetical protein